jgi:hypothetical protein
MTRIELASSVWKTEALPLSYIPANTLTEPAAWITLPDRRLPPIQACGSPSAGRAAPRSGICTLFVQFSPSHQRSCLGTRGSAYQPGDGNPDSVSATFDSPESVENVVITRLWRCERNRMPHNGWSPSARLAEVKFQVAVRARSAGCFDRISPGA